MQNTKSDTTLHKQYSKEDDSQLSGMSLSQALRSRNYWVFSPTWLFVGLGNLLIWTHIVPYATDMNITDIEASTIMSVMGGFALPSGILFGRISDNVGRKIPLIFLCLLRAGTLIGLIWIRELWLFYIFAVFFGISIGGTSVIIGALAADIFGKRSIGVIIGTLDLAASVGSALGPYIGGFVYDVYNSYTLAFIIAAIGNIIVVLLIALVKVEAKHELAKNRSLNL